MRAIFMAALILLASNIPASAKSYKVFKSGNWSGYTLYASSGKFIGCSIITRYVSGTLVSITATPSNKWFISLKRKGGYPPNKKFSTKLYVDRTFLFSGQARSSSSGIVRLFVPGTKRVINALRQGRILRLLTANGKSGYKLSGTKRAIAKLISCTIKTNRRSRNVTARRAPRGDAFGNAPTDAFSDGSSTGGVSSASRAEPRSSASGTRRVNVPREKLLVFVSNFLARAGFTGFRILPAKSNNKRNVVWKLADGSLGSLKAYHSSRGFSLDRLTGAVIAAATTACKGDFASGKRKTGLANGLEVRRLFASCNDQKSPYEVQYSLIKMKNGDLLRMSHFRYGKARASMDPAQMRRAESALLRVAKQDPGVLR